MAILTSSELAEGRQDVARRHPAVDYVKQDINAALQGLEDQLDNTTRGVWRGVITSAMSPFVPTDEQRDAIVAAFLRLKARSES